MVGQRGLLHLQAVDPAPSECTVTSDAYLSRFHLAPLNLAHSSSVTPPNSSPVSARAGPSNENTHATSVEPCPKRRRTNLEASLYGKSDEEVWDETDAAIIGA
jgi:hypothetical protein